MFAMTFCEPQTKVGTSVICHHYISILFQLCLLSSDMTMTDDKTYHIVLNNVITSSEEVVSAGLGVFFNIPP